jgi:type I site-specific restriction-modification system R (restriction) subunit
LQTALTTINPNIPADAIEDAIRKVTQTETPSLYENNHCFHKFLTDGVDVEYQADDHTKYDKVWLIDFQKLENNDWLAVDQSSRASFLKTAFSAFSATLSSLKQTAIRSSKRWIDWSDTYSHSK